MQTTLALDKMTVVEKLRLMAVYYGVKSDTVFVKAILDCRMDPRTHRRKLRDI